MSRRPAILMFLITLGASLLLLAPGGAHLRGAAARARAAEAAFTRVRHDAERVLALRSRAETVAAGEQPSQDVFRRVQETLARAGLSRVRVQSVSPAGDQALEADAQAGAPRRVQTVRIVLEPVHPEELGAFLDRWRREHALWIVTAIDLSAAAARREGGAYRATLTASALYLPEARPDLADQSGDTP